MDDEAGPFDLERPNSQCSQTVSMWRRCGALVEGAIFMGNLVEDEGESETTKEHPGSFAKLETT